VCVCVCVCVCEIMYFKMHVRNYIYIYIYLFIYCVCVLANVLMYVCTYEIVCVSLCILSPVTKLNTGQFAVPVTL
jgi:hypothetical protein